MPTIYIFPGAHKTGTSLLQSALEKCRPVLEEAGYAIARRQLFYSSGLHAGLRNRDSDLGLDVMRELAREVFMTPTLERDLVLSIENLFGEVSKHPYAQARRVLARLQDMLPDHQVRLTYFVRRQDTFLESFYVQTIHKGSDWDFSTFLDSYGEVNLDWVTLLKPIRRNIPSDALDVRAFETIKRGEASFIGSFFRTLPGLPYKKLSRMTVGKLGNTNRSLSVRGMEIARHNFSIIEDRREREAFATHLQALYGVDKYEKFRMPEDVRKRLAEKYQDSNRKLIRHFNLPKDLRDYYVFSDVTAINDIGAGSNNVR